MARAYIIVLHLSVLLSCRIQFPLIFSVIHGDFQMKFDTLVCHKNSQVEFEFGTLSQIDILN